MRFSVGETAALTAPDAQPAAAGPGGERIVGHGLDLVDIDRFAAFIERHAERAVPRLFTEAEADYARANPKRRIEHLAARFAAKEAALKALGTGWARGIAWTDVEVCRDAAGRPTLRLSGRAGEIAAERGIARIEISLTHTPAFAAASAIAVAAS